MLPLLLELVEDMGGAPIGIGEGRRERCRDDGGGGSLTSAECADLDLA